MPRSRPIPDDCRPLRKATADGQVSLTALARPPYPGSRLAEPELPGLKSIGFWDARGAQNWGLPMHRNEGIEICCLLGGETVFATEREEHLLRPGDITITRPWQRHRLGAPHIRPSRLFWIILEIESARPPQSWQLPEWSVPDDRARHEILRVLRRNQRCHLRDRERKLKRYLDDRLADLASPSALRGALAASIVGHTLLHVADTLSGQTDRPEGDPEGFHETIRHFFEGLTHDVESAAEAWTVAAIAHACRTGVTYLTKACRELFNCTPMEHLRRIRLAHAARLLHEQPETSVTEIAFRCGFGSSQYFATSFRRHYGCSPRHHRTIDVMDASTRAV